MHLNDVYVYIYEHMEAIFLTGFQRFNKHICKSIPGIDDFASYWLVEQQSICPLGVSPNESM